MKKRNVFTLVLAVMFLSVFTTGCELMFFGLGDNIVYGKVIAEFESEDPNMNIVFRKKGRYMINGTMSTGEEYTEEGEFSGNPKNDDTVTLTPTDRLGKIIDEKNKKSTNIKINNDKFTYQITYKLPVDVVFVRQ